MKVLLMWLGLVLSLALCGCKKKSPPPPQKQRARALAQRGPAQKATSRRVVARRGATPAPKRAIPRRRAKARPTPPRRRVVPKPKYKALKKEVLAQLKKWKIRTSIKLDYDPDDKSPFAKPKCRIDFGIFTKPQLVVVSIDCDATEPGDANSHETYFLQKRKKRWRRVKKRVLPALAKRVNAAFRKAKSPLTFRDSGCPMHFRPAPGKRRMEVVAGASLTEPSCTESVEVGTLYWRKGRFHWKPGAGR